MSVICLLLIGVTAHSAAARTVGIEEAYRLALQNNPTIQVLKERVVQAEAASAKAWSALKPTLSGQGTFTHYDQEIVIPFGSKLVEIQQQNQFAFSGVATLPLFRGPAYPAIGLARKGIEIARLNTIRSRQDFLLQVAQAYYLAVSRGDAVKALEHKLEVDHKHLAAARAQVEVGDVPRATVMRADLVATQDEQTLLAQRNGLLAAKKQLAILTGISGSLEVERPGEPPQLEGAEEQLARQAFKERADLQVVDLSIRMAQQSREAIWWGFLPALDLSWLYRWSEVSGFATKQDSWQLVLTLNVPLYDGGSRYADLRSSQSKILEAQEQQRGLRQQIASEIVRLKAEMTSAQAGVISAHKAVSLARTTEQDMEASFAVGAATQLDVLDASQRLLDAEIQLTTTLFTRDLTRLALAHALGQFDPGRRSR